MGNYKKYILRTDNGLLGSSVDIEFTTRLGAFKAWNKAKATNFSATVLEYIDGKHVNTPYQYSLA